MTDPPPQLSIQEWAIDKRVLVVAAWTATADYLAVQQELLEALGLRLEEVRQSRQQAE